MPALLVPLLAMQVARVQFPVEARPMLRVKTVDLFCNPTSGGTFSRTAIEILNWVKKFAVAHLEAWEYRIQRTA
jgi:hypothetical protein